MLSVLRNRPFRHLWAAGLFSLLGTEIGRLGLFLYLFREEGSVASLALLVALKTLPGLLAAPAAGVLADRLDKRALMIAADLLRALLLLGILARPELWVIYLASALDSVAGALFMPAKAASVPLLVGKEQVPAANGLDRTTANSMIVLGPVAGAAIFTTFGLAATLILDAASFLLSALLLIPVRVRSVAQREGVPPRKAWWRDVRQGWRYLADNPRPRQIVFLFFVSMLCCGLWIPLAPFFIRDFLGASDSLLGLQMACFGLGGMVGGIFAARLAQRLEGGSLLVLAVLAEGAHMVLYSRVPDPVGSCLVLASWGVVFSVIAVTSHSILQVEVEESMLGRIFSIVNQGEGVAILAAMLLASTLSAHVASQLVFLGAGLVYVALVVMQAASRGGRSLLVAPSPRALAPLVLLPLVLSLGACGPGDYRLERLAEDPFGGGDATLSPDGDRFVVSSNRDGDWDVWMYQVEDGSWSRITDDPADDFEARWSPDGRRLAFTSTRSGWKDLWLLDLEGGGPPRQLTEGEGDDEYPAFSPDGRRVLFTGGPWEARNFYLHDLDSGEVRPANPRPIHRGGACTFDPDGESLLCHKYDAGTGDLIRLWLEDGAMVPLTAGPDWDYKPWPSPDGRWVAYSRSQEGPADIWLLETATGRTRPLVRSPWEDRWPNWSADGRYLFFHRAVDRGREVRRLDLAGGEEEVLVEAAGQEGGPLQASLDPGGSRLAYCVQRADGRALRLLDLDGDLDGGHPRDLDTGPGEACYPRFSPDGRRLAFTAKVGGRWEVAVLELGSGRVSYPTAGTADLRGMDGPLDWSPDGRWLVFHADTGAFEADLYLVPAGDGPGEGASGPPGWTHPVGEGAVRALTRDPWFDESPAFTPDGRGVVFMSTRGGDWTWGLYELSLEDGSVRSLVEPDWEEKNQPRIGPGGSLLWAGAGPAGDGLVERSADGQLEPLVVEGGVRWPTYTTDGGSVVYTVVDHTVEYWRIENPLGRGSPWWEDGDEPEPPADAGLDRLALGGSPAPGGPTGTSSEPPGRSPIDLERR